MTDILTGLAAGIGTTVSITAAAFVLGALLAVPLVILRRSRIAPVRWVSTVVIEFIRAIPPIVWLFLIYYGISVGAFRFDTFSAAVVGFGLISGAYLAEIYRAALDSVADGQWEAARALGLRAWPTYAKVVIPQAMLLVVPPAATYAIGLLKDSAVASVVGATDIAFYAFQLARADSDRSMTVFLVSAAIYLVLSIPIAAVARLGGTWVEKRITA